MDLSTRIFVALRVFLPAARAQSPDRQRIDRQEIEERKQSVEILARLGDFEADGALFGDGFAGIAKSPRRAHAWLGGVNRYLNLNLELKFDAGNTGFAGGVPAVVGGNRPSEFTLPNRFPLDFA